MDYKEKIQILRACSSKKGNRCSSCPAFGQGDRNCSRNAMKDAATAISMLQAENERLWAELEQVLAERDAAVSWAQKYTESIDRPCVACKHNTGDYVCTAICGNCGPMGTENCKWEFDFSGELKED